MVHGKLVENTYVHICRAIKNRYNFYYPSQVVPARETAEAAMRISDVAPVIVPGGPVVEKQAEHPTAGVGWPDSRQRNDLDAFETTKGKGKRNPNDCLRCGIKGHNSENCPMARDSTDQTVNKGCNGQYHKWAQCPTAHPRPKGSGKTEETWQRLVWKRLW